MAWNMAPDNVLAAIFANLDIYDKLNVQDVCRAWHRCVEHPEVWKSLNLKTGSFYGGKLPPKILENIFRKLKFCEELIMDISGSDACKILIVASQRCRLLIRLKVTKSHLRIDITAKEFEDLSVSMKTLLSQNSQLRDINLDRIVLASSSNNQPLPIGLSHARKLNRLRLVNSLESCSPSTIMYLVNLTHLTITPSFLHFKLIKHLTECSLKRLNLVTRPRVPESSESLTDDQWKYLSTKSTFAVGCYTMKSIHMSFDWNQRIFSSKMPLRSIVYNKTSWLAYNSLLHFLQPFAATLEELVDFSLTKDGTHQQCDQVVIAFVQTFPRLHTLSLRSVLSTTTLLLMATLNSGFKHLPIREDMVTIDNSLDLNNYPQLSYDSKQFIEDNSQSLELFQAAMSVLLGKEWKLLSKQEYCVWVRAHYSYYFGDPMV